MTIKQDIRDKLAHGPMSLRDLAQVTGHDLESIRNAKGYLQADGIVRQVVGPKMGGARDVLFELVPIKAVSNHGNVLKSPVWVPPKPTHRPTIHAPGIVVRRLLTGEVLA